MSYKVKLFLSACAGALASLMALPLAQAQEVPGGAPPPPAVWRAEDLVDAMGVVTHIGYNAPGYAYANEAAVINALLYLGVTNVREALPDLQLGDPRLQRYYDLFQVGLKLSLTASICCGTGDDPGSQLLAADQTNLDDFETRYPGQITAVEGLNEPDLILNDGYTYTYNQYSGPTAVAHQQTDLYTMVKGDPLLAGLPVWEFSLNSAPYNQLSYESVYSAYAPVMQSFDWANTGDYTGTWSPEWKMMTTLFYPYDIGFNGQFTDGPYEPDVQGRPLVLKETGQVSTPTGDVSISATDYTVQAKITPGLYLDSIILGASHTFIYELADLYTDPNNTNLQYHWGLFDNSLNPKPAATVMKNVLAELKDNRAKAKTFNPRMLTVTVPQFPLYPQGAVNVGSGYTVVAQKANGTYLIMIWYEPVLWNTNTGSEMPVPEPVPVTMNLSQTCGETTIYDPYTGQQLKGPSNTNSISISLPDHVLMVRCKNPV